MNKLKPEIGQLLEESESAYSIVIAVAKRSRDLAEKAEAEGIELYDKPLNVAIDEFGAHRAVAVRGDKLEELF